VRDTVSRFKDQINVWDIVNEATHLPDKANQTTMARYGLEIGRVRYAGEPLKIARAANRNTLLLMNDYRTDRAYYELLKKLQEHGKYLFDVAGIQSHMHGGVWPLHQAWDICDGYSNLARPLHFTEITILSGPNHGSTYGETTPEGEANQAEKTVNFYRTLFGHPSIQAITWWDFSDYHAWQGAPAGWLRKDMSPKPVYDKLMSLIKGEWWTRIDGHTGPRGNFLTRAFYGTYKITVEPPGAPPITRQVQWERGQPNTFVFRI
jgi:GH35 family endo-1,4-beta-xylanase